MKFYSIRKFSSLSLFILFLTFLLLALYDFNHESIKTACALLRSDFISIGIICCTSQRRQWVDKCHGQPEVFTFQINSNCFTDSIKELYDYLLQREYAEPLSLDHQMERKAVRSPSMRLRFGRRSDPDVPLIGRVSGRWKQRLWSRQPDDNLLLCFKRKT